MGYAPGAILGMAGNDAMNGFNRCLRGLIDCFIYTYIYICIVYTYMCCNIHYSHPTRRAQYITLGMVVIEYLSIQYIYLIE